MIGPLMSIEVSYKKNQIMKCFISYHYTDLQFYIVIKSVNGSGRKKHKHICTEMMSNTVINKEEKHKIGKISKNFQDPCSGSYPKQGQTCYLY